MLRVGAGIDTPDIARIVRCCRQVGLPLAPAQSGRSRESYQLSLPGKEPEVNSMIKEHLSAAYSRLTDLAFFGGELQSLSTPPIREWALALNQ